MARVGRSTGATRCAASLCFGVWVLWAVFEWGVGCVRALRPGGFDVSNAQIKVDYRATVLERGAFAHVTPAQFSRPRPAGDGQYVGSLTG